MTEAESRLAKRYAQDLNIVLEQVQLVRGALVPATGDSAQTLRPAPRPFGPGRGSKKRPAPAAPETRKESPATTPPASARQPQPHDKAGTPLARKRGPVLPGAKSGKTGQKAWSGPKRNKPA
jgi:hypothetical protein